MPSPIVAKGAMELTFQGAKQFTLFGRQYARVYANLQVRGEMSKPELTGPLSFRIYYNLECGCNSVIGNFRRAYERVFPPNGVAEPGDGFTAELMSCSLDISDDYKRKLSKSNRIPRIPVPENGGVTTLATDIAGQPWLDGYTYGKGVNAVTGNLAGTAVVIPPVKQATGQSSLTTYSSITSSSDVEQQIQTSANGSYNLDGITLTASTSYLSDIKQSELYMTVIASFEASLNDYDTIDYSGTSITLTDQAKALIDNGKLDLFRNNYGDYFISGSKRAASFKAIFTLHTTSESDLLELEAQIGASAPEVFTAEGNAAFRNAIQQSNATVNMVLDMHGYAGTPPPNNWDIATVSEALSWFKSNMAPIPIFAEMLHYSVIDSRIPAVLQIDPVIFSEVGDIYSNTYMLQIAFSSLPSEWQIEYQTGVDHLVRLVRASAQELVINDKMRSDLDTTVATLLQTLQNLYQRVAFIKLVKNMQSNEPTIGDSQSGTKSFGSIAYSNSANDPAFVIQQISQEYKQGSTIGHREYDFVLNPSNGIIIQWEMIANWHDGTDGTWWLNEQNNNSGHILLNTGANIHAESAYDRGFDNTLTVWYVNADLIPASIR